jgi:transcriptional regulator with XRE-family HTH domain
MDLDYDRLRAVVIGECDARGWTQTELIEHSGVSRSTIQRIWKGDAAKPSRKTQRGLEAVFHWSGGSVLNVLRGSDPTPAKSGYAPKVSDDADTIEMSELDLDDPVIKELLSSSFQREEMRWELIRLYLADAAELEARARRRAAIRALRRATSASPAADSGAARLLRLLEVEDSSQDSDDAGQGRSTA